MKQYTWKTKDDDSWDNDCFDTQIKCVEDAMEQGYEPGVKLLIGETEEIPIGGDYFCGVLEEVETYMSCNVGDVADSWNISSTHGLYAERRPIYDKYNAKLNQLIRDYIAEIGEEPNFVEINNICEVTIKERRQKDD